MKLSTYALDHLVSILIYLLFLICLELFLLIFDVHVSIMIASFVLVMLFGGALLAYEYQRRAGYYRRLFAALDQLDQKYLVHELTSSPSFLEGKLLEEILYETDKSMSEHILQYQDALEDFKDYIEMWVHEVKLPIAAGQLILHNNPGEMNKKLREQFGRIENDVEQVLYYMRSENTEKDYLIKRCSLDELVQHVIRRNKDSLLYRRIRIEFEESGAMVFTDSKWIEFIINQIMSNAIKYCPEQGGCIRIETKEIGHEARLIISDNGIGISASDLGRVFEKSFTGQNGRVSKTSTGMGLYLCDKLCRRLGHAIAIDSAPGEGTSVCITFAADDYYQVVHEEERGEQDELDPQGGKHRKVLWQPLQPHQGGRPDVAAGGKRGVRRDHGRQRVRQDDAAELHRHDRSGEQRPHLCGWPRHHPPARKRPGAVSPRQHRLCLSGVQPAGYDDRL